MAQIDSSVVSERVAILDDIVERTTLKSLQKMVGRECNSILEGVSDEHEYLLSARPLIYAKDIDGDILINDTLDMEKEVGRLYRVKIESFIVLKVHGTF